ncbi:MAG: flagellar basal-body rod protein FlgC [Candidatus Atribacteria bacterium]|nr:flagellar basal-body rod protein FlgC [Candidatus Atribacteria bacterium]
MKIFRNFDVSASALTAERLRMDIISSNVANVDTTRTTGGGPYRRKIVVFEVGKEGGVRVNRIQEDSSTPSRLIYQPEHPDANAEGWVEYPNVILVNEMVDMLAATRAYEANVTALNATKTMMSSALNIGR